MLEILILSLVQGITEFLPISSSSHIILFSKFMNFISEDLILNVSLHIGSFLAVVVFFRKEILSFLIYRKVFMLIILASLPIILCGYLIAQSGIINDLRSLKIIGWTTVLFGILLYFSDKMENEKRKKGEKKEKNEFERFAFRFEAIDSRPVERTSLAQGESHPPYKNTWLRARDRLEDEPWIHLGLLAYMSDLDFMSTSMLPHGREKLKDGIQGASLDHSIWFHRPFRADDWLLFSKESPHAGGARGFVRGKFFTRDGHLVATAAQECLIRPNNP